jgi:hypothetical protein
MLIALCETEWLPTSYLAGRGKVRPSNGSAHLRILKKCGLVEQGLGRLYRLPPAFRPAPGAEWLDLGHIGLRIKPRA